MNYSEAVNYERICRLRPAVTFHLKQVKYLADMIGNPENKSRIIHLQEQMAKVL